MEKTSWLGDVILDGSTANNVVECPLGDNLARSLIQSFRVIQSVYCNSTVVDNCGKIWFCRSPGYIIQSELRFNIIKSIEIPIVTSVPIDSSFRDLFVIAHGRSG